MGFLDRFKKDASEPDAYTKEVAIRVRAMPGVDAVEAVDADHLSVRWTGHEQGTEVSIAAHRDRWQAASGFDRIEVVDELIESLAPPVEGPAVSPEPESVPQPDPVPDDVAARVLPALRRPVADGAVGWPVGELLEAVVALDGAPIDDDRLAGWGVDADEARRTALANLTGHEPRLDPVAPDTRAWVPTAPAGAQSAWLAAPDALLQASGLAVAIAFAPTPTDLVVVDPADVELLVSITTSTLAIVEQEATTIAAVPFEIRPGEVSPWRPPADHPCADLVERAHHAFGR